MFIYSNYIYIYWWYMGLLTANWDVPFPLAGQGPLSAAAIGHAWGELSGPPYINLSFNQRPSLLKHVETCTLQVQNKKTSTSSTQEHELESCPAVAWRCCEKTKSQAFGIDISRHAALLHCCTAALCSSPGWDHGLHGLHSFETLALIRGYLTY